MNKGALRKIVTHHLKYEIEIYFRINDMLRAYSRKLTKRIALISPSSFEIAPEILSKRHSPPEYDFHRSKIEFVLRASYGNNTAAFKKKKKKPTNKRASAMIKAVVPTRNDDSDDDWKEVLDDASGQTYFWNTRTNETTALGEPLQRQQRNVLQHHHHHHRGINDDIFSSSSPPNVMFVHMGTIFLFGIGGSIGFTLIAALLGFR